MVAKAKTTPEDMLADVLGAAAKKPASPSTQVPLVPHALPHKDTLPPKITKDAISDNVEAQDGSHKLQIIIPAELYTAMQLHKCLNGKSNNENSLKDIGINAITAYVAQSLAKVRGYE